VRVSELYGLEIITTAETARVWLESTLARLPETQLEQARVLDLCWILDIPAGISMRFLEGLIEAERSRCLVVTANLSPEYLQHLWNLGVRALIGEPFDLEDIARALEELSSGHRFRLTHTLEPRVEGTRFEVLVAAARFESNKAIAARLGKAEQTVKNEVGVLVDTLGLDSRDQLHSYFFGDWMYLPSPYSDVHDRITRGDGRKYVIAEYRSFEPEILGRGKRKRVR